MGDRTYVFRLRGDGGQLQAATEQAGRQIDQLAGKTTTYGRSAGVAGEEAAKGFRANGEAAKQAGAHVEGFSFKTAGAKRELLVLAHELSQGNYMQFGGSMLVLGERTGAASLLFSGLGIAVLAATGILVGFTSQVVKGYLEQQQFNRDLLTTGNYAGLTSSSLQALAKSVAQSSTGTVLQAREVVAALAATGDVGPRLIGPLADAMVRVQKATGATTEEITKDFAKLVEQPTKYAAEHNRAFNFISADQYAYIKRLEEQGNKEQAALEVSKLLSDHFKGQASEAVGYWAGRLKFAGEELSQIVDLMRSIGRETTMEARLDRLYTKLQAIKAAREQNEQFGRVGLPSRPGGGDDSKQREEQTQQQITETLYAEAAKKRQAYYAAETAARNKAQIAAVEYIDKIKEETKGRDLLTKKLEEYRRQVALLKGTASEVSAADQAAQEAAIRKRYDPVDVRAAQKLDNRFQERSVALQQEGVRLDAEIRSWELYGRAVDKGRVAVLNLEIEQGKLAGLAPGRIAQLRALAAADDAKDRQLDQAKLNAEVARSIDVLRSEATAQAQNARETEVARRLAELEAKGVKQATDAYAANAAEISKWVNVKHDGILAQKLAAEGRANDAEIAKIKAETAALGQSTIVRQKAIAVARLQAEAERDLAANPGQRAQILDALAEKTEKLTAEMDRGYAASRSLETGVSTALQRYRDEAANSASFADRVVGGGLSKLEDALTEFAKTGKLRFGSLFQFMADEFIRNWIRMQIAQQASASGSGGGLLGLVTSLAGLFGGGGVGAGTVGGSNVSAGGVAQTNFAKGGVVNRPTFFKFAAGGAVHNGQMGEAGTEGIFPLKRGRDGRLGVAAVGGGRGGLEVHVHNNAGVRVQTEQDEDGKLHILLEQVTERAANLGAQRGHAKVISDIRRGGAAHQAISSTYGVSRSAGLAARA